MEPFYLASVMSTASVPCHYLSLHALISASVAPWDTYNDGDAVQSPGASGKAPEGSGAGDSQVCKMTNRSSQPFQI